MVTRQELQQQQQRIQQARQQVQRAREEIPKVTQTRLRQLQNGVEGRLERQKEEKLRTQISTRERDIRQATTELEQSEKDLTKFEAQQERASQLQKAKEIFLDIRSGSELSSIPKSIQEQARREVEPIRKGLGVRSFFSGVEQVKQELLPSQKIVGGDIKRGKVFIEESAQIQTIDPSQLFTPRPTSVIESQNIFVKISGKIEQDPILSRVSNFGIIKGDIEKKFPRTSQFFQPFEQGEIAAVPNPIFALISPVKAVPRSIPLRQVRPESFILLKKTVPSPSGKPIPLSTIKISREIKPPSIKISKTEGILGKSDLTGLRPARLEITSSPFGIFGTKPFVALTTKGGKVGRIEVIAGKDVPTTLAEFSRLSRMQQFLWQRVAKELTGGRPVSLQNVPKILSQDTQKAVGVVQQIKLGKIDIGKKPTKLELLEKELAGKRTSQFETASQFRKLGETDEFTIFGGSIFFKDVTKPLSRATGKTPSIKGVVIEQKPVGFGNQKDVQFIKTIGVKKTPLSKTFQEVQQVQVRLPPIPPPKVSKPTTIKKQEPVRVGGIGILLPRLDGSLVSGQLNRIDSVSPDFVRGFQSFIPKATTKAKQETRQLTTSLQAPIQQQIPRQIEKQVSKQPQRVQQQPKQVPRQTQRQFLRNLLSLKQIQSPKTKTRTVQQPLRPIRPRAKPPIRIPKSETVVNKKGVKIKKINGKFAVFVRRFGIDNLISEGLTLEEARLLLESILSQTLARSGFLTKDKKKVRTDLGRKFRKSKVDPLRIVQLSKFSLGGLEVKEIQQARKNKLNKLGGKIKWLS